MLFAENLFAKAGFLCLAVFPVKTVHTRAELKAADSFLIAVAVSFLTIVFRTSTSLEVDSGRGSHCKFILKGKWVDLLCLFDHKSTGLFELGLVYAAFTRAAGSAEALSFEAGAVHSETLRFFAVAALSGLLAMLVELGRAERKDGGRSDLQPFGLYARERQI